jgi:hypothetical protein
MKFTPTLGLQISFTITTNIYGLGLFNNAVQQLRVHRIEW